MDVNQAKGLLTAAGLAITSQQRLNNDTGWQLRLANGGIVNIFDTGNFNVQGKCQPEIKGALGAPVVSAAITTTGSPAAAGGNKKVFVVYGHDETARNHLEAMCQVPDDCIDPRRRALFIGRETMRELIEELRRQKS